jgi:hypothetical protein
LDYRCIGKILPLEDTGGAINDLKPVPLRIDKSGDRFRRIATEPFQIKVETRGAVIEDERIWAVKSLLFDYVRSPSLRHLRDPLSVSKLANDIVKRIDQSNSIWKKWDGQREVVLKSAIGCWIPIDDLRHFLNRMPGPVLSKRCFLALVDSDRVPVL